MSARCELSDGWTAWPWVWLRGAGFPAAPVRELGSDALLAAQDAALAAEAAADRARAAAQGACHAARAAAPDHAGVRQALNRLRKGRAPLAPVGIAAVDAAAAAFAAALAELERCRQRAAALVDATHARATAQIEAAAAAPRLREAVCWQNPAALHNVLDKVRDGSASERGRRLRTALKYLQRYSLKNDTIGFFGPVAWGRVAPAAPGIAAAPGPALVEHRRVFFERWPIEILAEEAARDPAAFPLLRARRKPFSWVERGALHVPSAAPRPLTALEAFLLARADGGLTTAALIEAAAAAAPELGAGDPDATRAAAAAALRALAAERLVELALHVPAEVLDPEVWLRAALEPLADPEARARLLAPLDALEARRAAVARAAGDPAALDRAIGELEREFSARTAGLAAKRAHGRMYAGRQLFFEDCRRALALEVGGGLLRALAPPLALLLESARWFTWEIAAGYRRELAALHRGLAGAAPEGRVPLGALLAASRELFTTGPLASPIVARAQQGLQQRWLEVLELPPAALDAPRVSLAAAWCAARARARFAAPGPGWPRARHHSPDLMIAARSADAIGRGDALAVLGELHVATNTLLMAHAVAMHPEPAALVADWTLDLGEGVVSPVQAAADRASFVDPAPRDWHVELGRAASWRARDRVLSGGDLYVAARGDGGGDADPARLVVRSRTAALELDLIALLDHYLSAAAAPHFRLLPRRAHWPRITIDGLVVSRERWHLPKAELWRLVGAADTSYEQVHRWARELGLPRFVFATVPPEPKPIYVDLGCPLQIQIFISYARNASELGLSEMLPGHDHLWLTDSHGERYTSELRIAATDPQAWTPMIG